jgi:transcriptional regulator with XRE-family HTH domain
MMVDKQKAQELLQSVGNRIREFRKASGLTQEQLAEKVDIAPQYLSHLENGQRIPSLRTIIALAQELNTTPSVLLAEPQQDPQAERISRIAAIFRVLTERDAAFLESELRAWINHLSEHPQ